jgi:transaldolase
MKSSNETNGVFKQGGNVTMNPLNQLAAWGQSFWLDNIQRSMLINGELAHLIAEDSLSGVTSNPTIFCNAITKNQDYDEAILHILQQTPTINPVDLYERLAIHDIQLAADLLYPVFERTNGADGYVSFEVSPTLAHNTQGSIEEARRLFAAVDRPNMLIKIPGTEAGLPAISTLIGEGIPINVTLLFSLEQYERVADAYLAGLEQLAKGQADLSRVASVASFFISRVDTAFDNALEAIATPEALSLRGKVAIANAKIVYQRFLEIFSGERFAALQHKGAKVQRPLWASTGSKNPLYRDVIYVEELLGARTVNTMPPHTVAAFREHGQAEPRLTAETEQATRTLEQVQKLGVDYPALTNQLQQQGVAAFSDAFATLIDALAAKKNALELTAF